MATDIDTACQDMANAIIARLEAGEPPPWVKPWKGTGSPLPVNHVTGKAYSGVFNPMVLMFIGDARHGGDTRWAGFSQWKAAGGVVRKGEAATTIYMPSFGCGTCKRSVMPWFDKCGCGNILRRDGKDVPNAKGFIGFGTVAVFNAQQLVNPPPVEAVADIDPTVGFERAAVVVKGAGATVTFGGNSAAYSPTNDSIRMPVAGAFNSPAAYWGTFMHEHVHWTGAKSRLNREGITSSDGFGGKVYAMEELVAELGSAFLCHHLGVETQGIDEQHTAYIGHWIRALREDARVLQKVASSAGKAVSFLLKAAE
jgi:antirestriction protein ArdC